ncbi:MAG TPA: hypothetical protein VJC09_01740 [Candidatus Saccharimonadales bacterium]|nr:hypothetical protein [Candidatus Saccharimonadales bacterium]
MGDGAGGEKGGERPDNLDTVVESLANLYRDDPAAFKEAFRDGAQVMMEVGHEVWSDDRSTEENTAAIRARVAEKADSEEAEYSEPVRLMLRGLSRGYTGTEDSTAEPKPTTQPYWSTEAVPLTKTDLKLRLPNAHVNINGTPYTFAVDRELLANAVNVGNGFGREFDDTNGYKVSGITVVYSDELPHLGAKKEDKPPLLYDGTNISITLPKEVVKTSDTPDNVVATYNREINSQLETGLTQGAVTNESYGRRRKVFFGSFKVSPVLGAAVALTTIPDQNGSVERILGRGTIGAVVGEVATFAAAVAVSHVKNPMSFGNIKKRLPNRAKAKMDDTSEYSRFKAIPKALKTGPITLEPVPSPEDEPVAETVPETAEWRPTKGMIGGPH